MKMRKIITRTVLAFALAAPFVCLMCSFAQAKEEKVNTTPDVKLVTYNDNKMYYSDNFFKDASTKYNPHLATLSLYMANYSSPAGEIKREFNDKQIDEWYKNQPNKVKGFFESLGFSNFDSNNDYRSKTTFDTIGIGAASKKLSDGSTLIGVVPRSGGYYNEWGNNVFLGNGKNSDYMHEGWYNAANKLINFLDYYIDTKGIEGEVKIWISGFSRGGATANLAAGLLDNKLDKNEKLFNGKVQLKHDNIYAYTFEAPQGANINSKTVKAPKDKIYNNIFNIVNPDDLVPKLAMSQWGFTRFGIDKFIKTKFYDPKNYDQNENTFKKLYIENHGNWANYKAEKFDMIGTPIEKVGKFALDAITGNIGGVMNDKILTKDERKANYDINITTTLFLDELTKNIGTRDDYAKKFEPGLTKLLTYFSEGNYKDKDAKTSDLKAKLFQTFMYGVMTNALLPTGAAGLTYDKMVKVINSNEAIAGGAQLLSPLLNAAAKTYWERPEELISIATQTDNIYQNHDSDIIIAHLRSQDSYYVDNYNKENNDNIKLVELMDNADYGRVSFNCYNDVKLYDKDGKKVVDVEGKLLGKSDVKTCNPGYAVGYYSYITEEQMELFFPANQKLRMEIKDYSKKLYHTIKYWVYYQYYAIDEHNTYKKLNQSSTKNVWFNSDTYKVDLNVTK